MKKMYTESLYQRRNVGCFYKFTEYYFFQFFVKIFSEHERKTNKLTEISDYLKPLKLNHFKRINESLRMNVNIIVLIITDNS